MTMGLWVVRVTAEIGYDEWDAIVVVARDEKGALAAVPERTGDDAPRRPRPGGEQEQLDWVSSTRTATRIGAASDELDEGQIILESWNAG